MIKNYSNQFLKEILEKTKNIAIVGASSNPKRDSYIVMEFLIEKGYKVFPVNPNEINILGKKCYPNLKKIKDRVDMVDIFRAKDFIFDIAKEALEIKATVLWMQEGIIDEEAANFGINAGMLVIMNKCPKKILQDSNWTN